jgi:hypothetical protein
LIPVRAFMSLVGRERIFRNGENAPKKQLSFVIISSGPGKTPPAYAGSKQHRDGRSPARSHEWRQNAAEAARLRHDYTGWRKVMKDYLGSSLDWSSGTLTYLTNASHDRFPGEDLHRANQKIENGLPFSYLAPWWNRIVWTVWATMTQSNIVDMFWR